MKIRSFLVAVDDKIRGVSAPNDYKITNSYANKKYALLQFFSCCSAKSVIWLTVPGFTAYNKI